MTPAALAIIVARIRHFESASAAWCSVTAKSIEALQGPLVLFHVKHLSGCLAFEQSFLKWAERINLSAPSTLGRDLEPPYSGQCAAGPAWRRRPSNWLDIGLRGRISGRCYGDPDDGKRGRACRSRRKQPEESRISANNACPLKAPARVHPRRIEDTYALVRQPEIVTARALAPLPALLDLTAPWLSAGARGLFHKGRDYRSRGQRKSSTAGHSI